MPRALGRDLVDRWGAVGRSPTVCWWDSSQRIEVCQQQKRLSGRQKKADRKVRLKLQTDEAVDVQ